MSEQDEPVVPARRHPMRATPAPADATPLLPGPPPPLPDLAAVSASVDPPSVEAPATAPPVVASAGVPAPAIVRPTTDVAEVPAASRIPGAPAPGYGRLPTAPIATAAYGPSENGQAENDPAPWNDVEPAGPRAVVGPWALGLAILALGASFVVGWMLPVGLVAIVVAIVALRRPVERRGVGVWALVLGVLSVLYSAGWLLWAAWRAGLLA